MHRYKSLASISLAMLFSALVPGAAVAQQVDANMLLHPPADSWPIYHGDYSGRRNTALVEINQRNVSGMTLAWTFQAQSSQTIKSSPILVDGILYFTLPDNIYAIDARSGHQLWHYTAPPNHAFHIGQRGVSILKDKIYYMSTDAHALCLDAKTGKVLWDVVVGDSNAGNWSTMPPLIVNNHVVVGISGDFDNLQGFIRSLDPETGATQWTWYATLPVGTPKMTTGGNVWMMGTYDPEQNLMFWGTGNPTPVLNGKPRPGDNLYTCSIVALNPETGKLAWAFQPSPHDTHDWDAVETPVLADVDFKGVKHKVLMQASRNGYFFVVDRTTGKALITEPFGPVNWTLGVDKDGRPIPNPAKEPAPDGRLIAPDEGGMTNYRAPSFDPKTGLFIVSASPSYSVYFAKPADGTYGWAGADYGVWNKGVLEAIDYRTGKIRWEHDLGRRAGSGVLTTASGLTFSGDGEGNFLGLETATGRTLWHAGTGANIASSPISYQLDGHQVILMSSGSVLYAFRLPEQIGVATKKPRGMK
ncbi:MAG: acido-empty-quinoprotein group A [Edaphobacter sp.]|uniref:acido-empty-quinoprotein group A n=1 Tax=Edaphobacter sp. TaxID=1934404 RepID=UPI00238D12AC|nr:acido-empty-quinoprotein group A [Edaphobacter sp.]MDE1177308.1 acido-empty-quinoprotein group A [Edaphobacter sp.]